MSVPVTEGQAGEAQPALRSRRRGRARRALAAIPRVAWACALVGLLNAVAWSLLTPPFQVPDEIAHFAYVQQVAERGTLPQTHPMTVYSPEQQAAMDGIQFSAILGQLGNRPIWTDVQDRRLGRTLATGLRRTGNGDAAVATPQPPLYYAVEAVPYWVGRGGNVLTRLSLMRLVSCLLAAVTVLFVTLFVRELLPGAPWAWAVGGLAAALQPVFAFISSGVNGDALLFTTSAALFWALARAFRSGVTILAGRRIGLALAAGSLAKLTFLALVPGAALGILGLLLGTGRGQRPTAWRAAALTVAIAALPFAVYVALNVVVWHRSAIGASGITATAPGTEPAATSLRGELSYVWQLFLPRLPSMQLFHGGGGPYGVWFKGFIGRFGWIDYGFPGWVYPVAGWVSVGLLALVVLGLVRHRRALMRRAPELGVYVLMLAGLLAVIGHADYHAYVTHSPLFEQARYLLPLLALYAALLGLASRALGRKWGPALGAMIVVLAFGHNLFAQLITVARYYG